MINAKLQQSIKFVFLPALLLSLLLFSSRALFSFAQNTLIAQLGPDGIAAIKTYALIPQITLTLFLLIFSIYKPFEKIAKTTFVILTGIITLLTLFIFFQKHLIFNSLSESMGIYKSLLTYWPTSLMYILLNIFNLGLESIFIWGFINRLTYLSEGIKYYIPLAFILGIIALGTASLGLIGIQPSNWPLMVLLISGTLLMVCFLFAFNSFWKKLPHDLIHPEISSISNNRFPFLNGAYLLAGFAMIGSLLTMIFKSELKAQFSNASDYSHFIQNYSMYVATATVAFSIIWAVLGSLLIVKKGWKTTALYGSLSILVGGILFFSIPLPSLAQGIFKGLLTSTALSLFFPLIQVLYLYLPYQYRFKTKIITEVVASPILKQIPSLATQGLLVFFGSMITITPYLKILTLILMILLVIASYRVSLKLIK